MHERLQPGENMPDPEGENELISAGIKKIIRQAEVHEFQVPERMFFIFPDTATRDKALSLIADRRQSDSRLHYLKDFKIDPKRSDRGIELDFTRTEKGAQQNLEALFKENGIVISEEYEVVDDPEKGTISPPVSDAEKN